MLSETEKKTGSRRGACLRRRHFAKGRDKIPADARVVQSFNLQVEEAALTGESVPVEKRIDALGGDEAGLGDRNNMVYSGTVVSYGRGRAVVTAIGMNTEFGKITGMLQEVETAKTPLQKNLDQVGKNLAKAAGVIVVIIVALGLFRGQPFLEMIIFGIALAVAVVPRPCRQLLLSRWPSAFSGWSSAMPLYVACR